MTVEERPEAGPEGTPALELGEIQGNIVAGFLKDHQIFLFLQFPDGAPDRPAGWLRDLTPRISPTQEVGTFNAAFSDARRNRGGDDPENLKALWVNVGLTHSGFLLLAPGAASVLARFEAFSAGPAARAPELRDGGESDPATWLFGTADTRRIDAVVTIAADDVEDLRGELTRQRQLIAQHGLLTVYEQLGETLPGHRAGHEHFGFKDGISQPGIVGFHEEDPDRPGERKGHPGTELIPPGEFVLGYPTASGGPAAVPHWLRNGSFQVFRRLRQDVPGWWAQVGRCRDGLPSFPPTSDDLLAAKFVGRWRSGSPLALAPDRDNRSSRVRSRDNDFAFGDDPHGYKTPQFAHIRKVYPRDDAFKDDAHRILRRGIPFGRTFDPAAGRGHGVDAERGLLFNVFCASIENQFEFLQRAWANTADFPPGSAAGPDPVAGDDASPLRLRREGVPDASLDVRRLVVTTGAVYAFAPSLSTLRVLGEGQIPVDEEEPQPPPTPVGW